MNRCGFKLDKRCQSNRISALASPVFLYNFFGGLEWPGKVGRQDGVERHVGERLAGGGGLLAAALVQVPVTLALNDLVGVGLCLSAESIS